MVESSPASKLYSALERFALRSLCFSDVMVCDWTRLDTLPRRGEKISSVAFFSLSELSFLLDSFCSTETNSS